VRLSKFLKLLAQLLSNCAPLGLITITNVGLKLYLRSGIWNNLIRRITLTIYRKFHEGAGTRQIDQLGGLLFLPAWFDPLGKSFCYKKVQFKKFPTFGNQLPYNLASNWVQKYSQLFTRKHYLLWRPTCDSVACRAVFNWVS